MKAKTKKLTLIIIYAIILIAYLVGFGIVFNLKNILGIGYYNEQKSFSVILNGASCGLNVEIYASHQGYHDHDYGYRLTAFSSGDVELEGIDYLYYRVEAHGTLFEFLDMNYTTPIISHSLDDQTRLYQNDNLTINGFADIIFTVNNVNETHRIPIELGVYIELDGEDINYEWGNISTWLNVIYLSFTVVPIMLLYRNMKKMKFITWYKEEFKLRDKKFFDILSRKKTHED